MAREESLFHEALARPAGPDRKAFLDSACAGQTELRAAVEALLEAHEKTGDFILDPQVEDEPTQPPGDGGGLGTPAEKPGARIGPYKLLQKIGEGGMGTVWMAEQEHPVRRRVALKIIKPGMDSAQIIARFEAERQALAMMDHLNIAKVLDAGATPAGRPFFVMELVHGVPITRYCDENKLDPRARLELFIPVCQAIQHAHQKGVIHRDIKPSNVLVTLYDGKPVPKVIDFGVAKAVEQRLTDKTMFTQYGQIVGTLEYMSPEQAEMSALGVDTRSDVYSLGVLLYELLTGTTPVDRKQLREAAFVEVLRIIKEDEPPRPSMRLSTTEELASIAASRGIDPGALTRVVQGDLDWIVMKCLEKDRTRRYESASSLARDVERHLRDEPVEACPPSLWYRWRKFARRHRTAMTAASIAFWAIVSSQVVTAWYAYKAAVANESNRILAHGLQGALDNANVERQRAEAEAHKAESARQAEAKARKQLSQSLDLRTRELRRSEAWRLAHAALVQKPQEPELVGPLVREALRLHDDAMTRSTSLMALADLPVPRPLGQPAKTGLGYWFAFMPDGRSIIFPEHFGSRLNRYDFATGQSLGSFPMKHPTATPSDAVLSPDGSFLATVSNHQIYLWRIEDGKLLHRLDHEQIHYSIENLVVSRDSRCLTALAVEKRQSSAGVPAPDCEHQVWQWTLPDMKPRLLFSTREHDLLYLDVSSDGSRVGVMGRRSRNLIFLDAVNGSVLWTKPLGAMLAHGWVRVAPGGNAVCVPHARGVRYIPAQDGEAQELTFPDLANPLTNGTGVSASADGRTLLLTPSIARITLSSRSTLSIPGPVYLFTFSGGFRRPLGGASEMLELAHLSADGRRVVASNGKGDLLVWDVGTGQLTNRIRLMWKSIDQMHLSPDGRTACCVRDGTSQVYLMDLDHHGLLPHVHLPSSAWVMTDGGGTLQVVGDSMRLWQLDAGTLDPRLVSKVSFNVSSFGWRLVAGGKRLLYHHADFERNPVQHSGALMNTANSDIVARIPNLWLGGGRPYNSLLTSRHDGRLFLADMMADPKLDVADRNVSVPHHLVVFDALTGKEHCRIRTDEPVVGFREGAFSDDGRYVAVIPIPKAQASRAGVISRIIVWDNELQQIVDRLDDPRPPHDDTQRVEGLAFSADARRLVIWQHNGLVILWDRATKKRVLEIRADDKPVRSAAMSRDGRWLAASTDGQVLLWNAATGELVFKIGNNFKTAYELNFTANDEYLLGVSEGNFQLWPIDLPGHLERQGIRMLAPGERLRLGLAPIPLP